MAPKLLLSRQNRSASSASEVQQKVADQRMRKDSLMRFSAVVLAIVTAAAVVFSAINLQKENQFPSPYDGVWWMAKDGALVAKQLTPGGPAEKAGIKVGDKLLTVNDQPIHRVAALERQLSRTGIFLKASYTLDRHGVKVEKTSVILGDKYKTLNHGLRLIALIYLGIGFYVLFRRWTAPKSTHFYVFCLVSFVLYSVHYTGKLNGFDSIILWSNIVAGLLQPALLLHFALTFPEKRGLVAKRPWLIVLTYVPGAILLANQIIMLTWFEASETLRWNLDRVDMFYLAIYFIVAASVLWGSYRKANTPLERQQMKWISRCTVLAIPPFTLFYVAPYLYGALPTTGMKISLLSLVFLPLPFGYAIVRNRLTARDLIFKRGVAYTLATAAIVGAYFVVIGSVVGSFTTKFPSAGTAGLIAAIIITAVAFEPLKNWFQDRVDRFFYRTRYDYRRTLIEFGRELSSEMDLGAMLASVIDRLSRTLLVDRIAVFMATGST